jgi:hypothetical protein
MSPRFPHLARPIFPAIETPRLVSRSEKEQTPAQENDTQNATYTNGAATPESVQQFVAENNICAPVETEIPAPDESPQQNEEIQPAPCEVSTHEVSTHFEENLAQDAETTAEIEADALDEDSTANWMMNRLRPIPLRAARRANRLRRASLICSLPNGKPRAIPVSASASF